jgi:regulator of protease activity HflC (stomatin/prohibitin superfamily)
MSQTIQEFPAFKVNGFIMLAAVAASGLVASWSVWSSLPDLEAILEQTMKITDFFGQDSIEIGAGLVASLLAIPALTGFLTVQPNQAVSLVVFGQYRGTVSAAGFWWTNPLASQQRISLRVRNFNSKVIKVNDAEGSPIEIAAVVVWQVLDAAKSMFAVDNYEEFVAIQSETAIRALAIRYPYDSPTDSNIPSLRGIPDEIAQALRTELQARLAVTGVEVMEARLSHLAYAPEIAQVMLRRQQAKALIDARRQIVEGAVGIVNAALNQLSQEQLIELDGDRKAAMINNLLVILTSEQTVQPVINTGTLYH